MSKTQDWLAVFRSRRIAAILLLGFSSGLPLALTAGTLQAWMTVEGLDLQTIGYMTLVGQPYVFKFIWAPIIDRFEWLAFGRRRGWLATMQLLLAAGLFGMALIGAHAPAPVLFGAALAIAFFSATQDIAFDAYRVDLLHENERGTGAAVAVLGYRLAMLVSGGLALWLADHVLGWPGTYQLMAVVMIGLAAVTLFFAPRVAAPAQAPTDSAAESLRGFAAMLIAGGVAGYLAYLALASLPLTGAFERLGRDLLIVFIGMAAGYLAARAARYRSILDPLDAFLSRDGAVWILLLVILYKLGDAFAGALTTSFLIRGVGFSAGEVGLINKSVGLAATLFGALLGGAWMSQLGLYRSLLLFGLLQMVSNLAYWFLAVSAKSLLSMALAVTIENLCGGMGTAAFVALLMALCDRRFSATQFALLSALASVGRVYVGPASGLLVTAFGWPTFFLGTVVTAVPGVLLLIALRARVRKLEAPPPGTLLDEV